MFFPFGRTRAVGEVKNDIFFVTEKKMKGFDFLFLLLELGSFFTWDQRVGISKVIRT